MSGPGGQDQGGGEKNAYYILWMIALVTLIGGVIWYFFHDQLKAFFIVLRQYELMATYLVVGFFPYDLLAEYIPWLTIPDLSKRVANDLFLARQLTPSTLTGDIAFALSTEVGEFIRYPVAIILAFFAYYVYNNHILMRFTRKHNMKTLSVSEQKLWPQIKVVNQINLLTEDLDSGPWAMAMTPMQFAKKNKLILVEFADNAGREFSKTPLPEFKVSLNRARAERAFAFQLGKPFQGIAAMAPHRRAIFAVLAAKACRDTAGAQELIYQLARSQGANLSGADELWKKYYKAKNVEKVCSQYAYEFTMIAGMILLAREDGVLASADFLWVKPMDRRLWYVLNNVGRQTPAAEVGGIFAHWYNELALKRPLSVPVVEGAVDALELALSEVIYLPDDKEREEIIKRAEEKRETAEVLEDE